MADDLFSVSKTIRLTELSDTKSYRLWAAQTEATFGVHGVMDIVLGERLRPEVPETSEMTEDAVRQIKKWDRQHALARQALLACLSQSVLMNVY
jgi:hypothetical protein